MFPEWLRGSQSGFTYQPHEHHCKLPSQRIQLHAKQLLPIKCSLAKTYRSTVLYYPQQMLSFRENQLKNTQTKQHTNKTNHAVIFEAASSVAVFKRQFLGKLPTGQLSHFSHLQHVKFLSLNTLFILKMREKRQRWFPVTEEYNFSTTVTAAFQLGTVWPAIYGTLVKGQTKPMAPHYMNTLSSPCFKVLKL